MSAVLASIKTRHVRDIIYDMKHWEIRPNRPKSNAPFTVYIYCTQSELLTKSAFNGDIYIARKKSYRQALEKHGNLTFSGKVIGEFICDKIVEILPCAEYYESGYCVHDDMISEICLSRKELMAYGKGRKLYAWHISELYIYDEPKELSEFASVSSIMKRPPQSWCYVEELK